MIGIITREGVVDITVVDTGTEEAEVEGMMAGTETVEVTVRMEAVTGTDVVGTTEREEATEEEVTEEEEITRIDKKTTRSHLQLPIWVPQYNNMSAKKIYPKHYDLPGLTAIYESCHADVRIGSFSYT